MKLGEVSINKEAFELDLKINEGYQNYSAELLRLALLVDAGLGAVWMKLYLDPKLCPGRATGVAFLLAFLAAVAAAGSALLHRYVAPDSLAYHLTALRYRARGLPRQGERLSDEELAEDQEKKRNVRFKWSGRLLASSVAALVVALLFFCVSMGTVMFRARQ